MNFEEWLEQFVEDYELTDHQLRTLETEGRKTLNQTAA